MSEDRSLDLIADVVEGLSRGAVADAIPTLTVQRCDDGTVLEVDLGDPDLIYVVTVTSMEKVD